jgi:hypothetical protein
MTLRPPAQAGQTEPARRPPSVTAVAVVLIIVGVVTALGGIALSAVSNCCGSSDPADPSAALIGIGVAAAMLVAGIGLWSGRLPRAVLLLCSAALPTVVVAASPSSSDLAGLVPVVVLGWLALWWYLRRPAASGWIGRAAAPDDLRTSDGSTKRHDPPTR